MTGTREVVLPIPRRRDLYAHLYNRIYRKLYDRLKPLYRDLAEISGSFPKEMIPPV